ncbi:MAG: hypothetical protein A3J27_01830 [Candidatus Tectomicrobia bacterium RIFCSPLOWO2_12_FULL_69_37]|nr:MAG: hypothetical protein A3J27_01830 [Candidatus Tectomicrobia bacterium RIFCSPLOWO2_12_FULL_69_37]OGL58937.1 MAG: hypothetical protein A3I72_15295 [Candidatus Tectomicrobia bacterium RIFCSPLOWO2_02_FULL_70_19]
MSRGSDKASPWGVLLIGLFGLGFAAGGGYGLWVVIPKGTVTTSVCVRSVDVHTRTTRSRRGFSFSSKELRLRAAAQPVVFYHGLGTVVVDRALPRRVNMGECYRVEVDKGDYEEHLRRPVSAGYGIQRTYTGYAQGDLPRVKMYSMARGEEVFFTPFDAYGWDAIGLGVMGLFGLFLMFCSLRAAEEA